jgi:hypothetical protein
MTELQTVAQLGASFATIASLVIAVHQHALSRPSIDSATDNLRIIRDAPPEQIDENSLYLYEVAHAALRQATLRREFEKSYFPVAPLESFAFPVLSFILVTVAPHTAAPGAFTLTGATLLLVSVAYLVAELSGMVRLRRFLRKGRPCRSIQGLDLFLPPDTRDALSKLRITRGTEANAVGSRTLHVARRNWVPRLASTDHTHPSMARPVAPSKSATLA